MGEQALRDHFVIPVIQAKLANHLVNNRCKSKLRELIRDSFEVVDLILEIREEEPSRLSKISERDIRMRATRSAMLKEREKKEDGGSDE